MLLGNIRRAVLTAMETTLLEPIHTLDFGAIEPQQWCDVATIVEDELDLDLDSAECQCEDSFTESIKDVTQYDDIVLIEFLTADEHDEDQLNDYLDNEPVGEIIPPTIEGTDAEYPTDIDPALAKELAEIEPDESEADEDVFGDDDEY